MKAECFVTILPESDDLQTFKVILPGVVVVSDRASLVDKIIEAWNLWKADNEARLEEVRAARIAAQPKRITLDDLDI